MKLKDSINYTLIKVKRNKKNIFFILILAICTTTIIGALYYKETFLRSVDHSITKNLKSRSVTVTYPEENHDYSSILNIEHIEEIYNFKYHHSYAISDDFKNAKYSGDITLKYGSENMLPKNITGKKITSNDTGVAICPKYFYPSDSNKINYFDSKLFLTNADILNKNFSIKIKKTALINEERVETGIYTKNFKIIGTYDPLETDDTLNTCYISTKDMIEIYNETKADLNISLYQTMYLIIDDIENVQQIQSNLIKNGYLVDSVFLLNLDEIINIKDLANLIIIIAIFTIVLLTILYINKRNINNLHKIGVLKSLGFKNKEIEVLNINETLWITLFSFLIGLVFIEMIILIISIFFKNYLIYNYLTIKHSIKPYLITFILIVIIPLITNIVLNYKNKKKKKA